MNLDKLHFNYSQKNIPIPTKTAYQRQLVDKVANFATRLRWKMIHILNPNQHTKQTYGFRTTSSPPQVPQLKAFEDDLFSLISNIKYRPVLNEFQMKLKEDRNEIINTTGVIVKADKSDNLYKMDVADYRKKVIENVTKDYKKSSWADLDQVTKEAASIARKFDLADRIDIPTEDQCFITIKDHKKSFPGKVECRLINPAKNNLGTISKNIIDKINSAVRKATNSNQWQNTSAAIRWFNSITNKHNKTFFKFDIVSFYPSITAKLLRDAISWAKAFISISDSDMKLIFHCRKMFLFLEDDVWVKKDNPDFDVSMGGLDSAEVCELVGLYILSQMERLIPREDLGLYRDDGLGVVDLPGPEIERLRKKVVKLFSDHGLQITTEVNIKTTDFLDVMFNLETDSYKPFRKDSSSPVYIHHQSNHPKHVIKGLPKMIGKRIAGLSANEDIFKAEAPLYNNALRLSGYKETITYEKQPEQRANNRRRKVTWFNPPFNNGVETNVARKFLALVDKHFPKGSQLAKYFNRKTIKVSYCTTANFASIISRHNKKVTGSNMQLKEKGCNCRKPTDCVLKGKCQTSDLVYKCSVLSTNNVKEYIGLASTTFKQRFSNHKASLAHISNAHKTTLSAYVWDLKEKNAPFSLDWSIVGLAPAYNRKVRKCHLCLLEKSSITFSDPLRTINKRNEIVSKCRHRDKLLLKNW